MSIFEIVHSWALERSQRSDNRSTSVRYLSLVSNSFGKQTSSIEGYSLASPPVLVSRQKTRHLTNHSTTSQISHSCHWNWFRRGHKSQTVAARERASVSLRWEMLTGVVSRSLQPLMSPASRVKLGVYSDWDGDIRPARQRCPGGQLTPGFMAALGADKGFTRRWIKNRFIRRYHSRYCCLARWRNGRPFMWLPYLGLWESVWCCWEFCD